MQSLPGLQSGGLSFMFGLSFAPLQSSSPQLQVSGCGVVPPVHWNWPMTQA